MTETHPHAPTADPTASACPVRTAPGPGRKPRRPPAAKLLSKRLGLFALAKRSRNNVLEVIPAQSLHRKIISGRLLRRFHIVTDPEGVRQILKGKSTQYPKAPEMAGVLGKALKKGVFVTEGEEWRWQRRAVAPVFAPRNITGLAPLMTRAAETSAERLAAADGPVNISDEMMRAAFDVIASVSFTDDHGESTVPLDVIHRAIEHYLSETGRMSLLDYLGLPRWVPRPGRTITHPTLRALKKAADQAIEQRRQAEPRESRALIDLMIRAEDPDTGRRMTTEELRDNLITFLIAGHETTALALSWSLYLVAFDQKVQRKARAEARQVLQGRAATAEDVPKLDYIRQIFLEAMRLYPPIPVHLRTATAGDTVCEHAVKKGDTMLLPFYALHRHHQLWEKPHQFIPERFADMSKIDRYAYVPFSTGPRICLGADFAMQESLIILATLLSRYRFRPVPGRRPKPKLILTLRAEGGIWLNVEPIDAA